MSNSEHLKLFEFETPDAESKALKWIEFLVENSFNFQSVKKISFKSECPTVFDQHGNKFKIDFINNKMNYKKTKKSIKTEIIGRALGSGKDGLRVLDLSAGLGIDAIFLSQLGFEVEAVERNPLVFLCLQNALELSSLKTLRFSFGEGLEVLKSKAQQYDVIYFDPMFPEKKKSALARQEMVFFKNLIGSDPDAESIVQYIVENTKIKRLAVKRPVKAPTLLPKPFSVIEGKLVRFDVYRGIQK